MDNRSTFLMTQTATLLMLAIPVACVAWTITHEEVFREAREHCRLKVQGFGSESLFV